jgi:hypothetical protein
VTLLDDGVEEGGRGLDAMGRRHPRGDLGLAAAAVVGVGVAGEAAAAPSFASAARAIAVWLVSCATSVAVMPRERARIQPTRSRESATIRAASSGASARKPPESCHRG